MPISPYLQLTLLLSATMLAWGCGETNPTVGNVEVGTGEWQFESFEDGDALPLVRGSQGGHHVWISVRSDTMATGNATLSIETQLADDSGEPQRSQVPITLTPSLNGMFAEYLGWPAVIARPGCFADKMLRVRVSLSDSNGVHAQVDRYLIPTGEDLPDCPS